MPSAPATLANPATACVDQRPTVADFASVAGQKAKSALPSAETVARLVSVAEAEVRFAVDEVTTAPPAAVANLGAMWPADVPTPGWQKPVLDNKHFLAECSDAAAAAGWAAGDLFRAYHTDSGRRTR